MSSMRSRVLGGAVVLAMVSGGVGTAQAAPDDSSTPGGTAVAKDSPGRATLAGPDINAAKYTDMQILEFLVLAEGPIAQDHPELAAELGFVQPPESTDREAARLLMRDYLAAHPEFRGRVAAQLQSGNPARVDAALEYFATTFNDFVTELYGAAEAPSGDVSANGWFYTAQYVATAGWALAVAGAVVYGAVAGFHVGVAVTTIVYVYLPGMEGEARALQRDTMVRSITNALAA